MCRKIVKEKYFAYVRFLLEFLLELDIYVGHSVTCDNAFLLVSLMLLVLQVPQTIGCF